MLTWIIAAGMVALFTSLVIIFINAILDLYDAVVKGIKKYIMAKKAMKVSKNGKVEAATVTVDEKGNVQVHTDVKSETLSESDKNKLDPEMLKAIEKAKAQAKRENVDAVFVEAKMDAETEAEIRRRRSA